MSEAATRTPSWGPTQATLNETSIAWCDYTWNPAHGCAKVSPGCANCYAETVSRRFNHTEHPWTPEHAAANVQLKPNRLDAPYARHEPGFVFVNSMFDQFHEQIPDHYIEREIAVMGNVREDVFQILTKHDPGRAADFDWPDNVWIGVSCESPDYTWRIDAFEDVDATTWVSFEPLLEEIGDVDLGHVDWIVVGGESEASGDYRPMDHAWARDLRRQAIDQDVAFFFKQSAARYPERGRLLELGDGHGQVFEEYPPLPDVTVEAREVVVDE